MKNRKRKAQFKSNLDNATPEQKESFYRRLTVAHHILFRSVIERKVSEMLSSGEDVLISK